MNNFRFLGHLDVSAVQLARLSLCEPIGRSWLLRGPAAPAIEDSGEDLPLDDYPGLLAWPEMQKLLRSAVRMIAADPAMRKAISRDLVPGRIMVSSLFGGAAVQWHIDTGVYHERFARFHVPLTTNPGARMYSGDESAHADAGNLFWFNNRVLHSAANWGMQPRAHLIFEMRRSEAA